MLQCLAVCTFILIIPNNWMKLNTNRCFETTELEAETLYFYFLNLFILIHFKPVSVRASFSASLILSTLIIILPTVLVITLVHVYCQHQCSR